MSKSLICRCGALMVSNGEEWVCQLNGTSISGDGAKTHSGDTHPDNRLTVNKSVTVEVVQSEPGLAGSKAKRMQAKGHPGLQAECRRCTPNYRPKKRFGRER